MGRVSGSLRGAVSTLFAALQSLNGGGVGVGIGAGLAEVRYGGMLVPCNLTVITQFVSDGHDLLPLKSGAVSGKISRRELCHSDFLFVISSREVVHFLYLRLSCFVESAPRPFTLRKS